MPHRFIIASLFTLIGITATAGAIAEDRSRALDGRWRLDWDRSESFEPALEAMEVGWFIRRLAGVARVEVGIVGLLRECDTCPERLELTFSSPISDRTDVVLLDDQPRPGKDPQGNDTIDRYRPTKNGGVELVRLRTLPSGRSVRLIETRTPGDATTSMLSTMVVFVDGEERANIRRVFERIGDQVETGE